jgi:hypothetical protein
MQAKNLNIVTVTVVRYCIYFLEWLASKGYIDELEEAFPGMREAELKKLDHKKRTIVKKRLSFV